MMNFNRMTSSLWKTIFRCVAVGSLAGGLAGIFGVGCGFIMGPLFVMWLAMEQKNANATSLLAMVFIASAGLVGYIDSQNVRWDYAGLVLLGGVLGTLLGVRIFNNISPSILRNIFVVALLVVALRLFWSISPHQIFSGALALVILTLIGIVSGTLSGLLGIGGGIIIVPALILCSGLDPEVARGTSLVVIIGTAILGSAMHSKSGHVNHEIALYTGISGIPAAIACSYLAISVSNRIILSLFALLLVAVAGQLVRTTRGQ